MDYRFNPVSAIAFCSAAVMGCLAGYAFSRRSVKGVRAFIMLLAALFFYCFGAGFEFMSLTPGIAVQWTHIEYLGIAFIPTALILFAVSYCSIEIGRGLRAALFGVSCITLTAQLTTEATGLFYRNIRYSYEGIIPTLAFSPGPFYLVHQTYMTIALAILLVSLVHQYRESEGVLHAQAGIILGSLAFPLAGFVVYLGSFSPGRLDINPLTFLCMGVFTAYGLFRRGLFDLTPVALRSVFATMREGCIILDSRNHIVECNTAAMTILPRLNASSIGMPAEACLAGYPQLAELVRAGTGDSDIIVGEGADTRCYSASISLVSDRQDRVQGRTIIIADTSRLYQLTEQLRELAARDSLTGLYSRRYFFELAERFFEQARRGGHAISLVMFDIDHFKEINDNYGHLTGDRVLKAVATGCRSLVRSSDVICRYGGDEFLILLPETDTAAAEQTTGRILTGLLSSVNVALEGEVPFSASFGLAAMDRAETGGVDELVRRADEALYDAKTSGRGCVRVWRPDRRKMG